MSRISFAQNGRVYKHKVRADNAMYMSHSCTRFTFVVLETGVGVDIALRSTSGVRGVSHSGEPLSAFDDELYNSNRL